MKKEDKLNKGEQKEQCNEKMKLLSQKVENTNR